jgi:hypothetical protein
MKVRAHRFLRKMRGGAQAHLVESADGRFWVVKFSNNPQHRRILVNEWIAAALLNYLRLPVPEVAAVDLDPGFLEANPEVHLQLGSRRLPVPPGPHFGSCFPGDPARTAVYDFLPDTLLQTVANGGDFLGALVFDQWTSNADARQAVFVRSPVSDPADTPSKMRFTARLIDHGFILAGPDWVFRDSPVQGLYHRPAVYSGCTGWSSFEPWMERVRAMPETVLDAAVRSLPPQWLESDEEALYRLLNRLLDRRGRLAALIEDVRGSRARPFPNWGAGR